MNKRRSSKKSNSFFYYKVLIENELTVYVALYAQNHICISSENVLI